MINMAHRWEILNIINAGCAVVMLMFSEASMRSFAFGGVIMVIGFGLRLGARAYYSDSDEHRLGLWRHMRAPDILSTFAFALGCSIAGRLGTMFGAIVIAWGVFHVILSMRGRFNYRGEHQRASNEPDLFPQLLPTPGADAQSHRLRRAELMIFFRKALWTEIGHVLLLMVCFGHLFLMIQYPLQTQNILIFGIVEVISILIFQFRFLIFNSYQKWQGARA
jgi:hypothetical protein